MVYLKPREIISWLVTTREKRAEHRTPILDVHPLFTTYAGKQIETNEDDKRPQILMLSLHPYSPGISHIVGIQMQFY